MGRGRKKGTKLTKEHRQNISLNHTDVGGENNPNWKGGRAKHEQGYIYIHKPNHPNATKDGYVFEHRLIMENFYGRLLRGDEIVHHLNGEKDDNREDNLAVVSHKFHSELHS